MQFMLCAKHMNQKQIGTKEETIKIFWKDFNQYENQILKLSFNKDSDAYIHEYMKV